MTTESLSTIISVKSLHVVPKQWIEILSVWYNIVVIEYNYSWFTFKKRSFSYDQWTRSRQFCCVYSLLGYPVSWSSFPNIREGIVVYFLIVCLTFCTCPVVQSICVIHVSTVCNSHSSFQRVEKLCSCSLSIFGYCIVTKSFWNFLQLWNFYTCSYCVIGDK